MGIGWLLLLAVAGAGLALAAALWLRHPHLPFWGASLGPASPDPASDAPASPAAPKVERTLPLGTRARPLTTSPSDGIQVHEPLVGADSSQAQGFYHEIAELLTAQLEVDPARLDLHRTLLDVYRAAGQAEQYVRYAQAYYERSNGGDAHWGAIASAGREMLPGHSLFEDVPGAKGQKKFQRFYETVSQIRLHGALRAMSASYEAARADDRFDDELHKAMTDGARRPTPLSPLPPAGGERAGATLFAKREDVRAANDDQLINAIGQILLAQRLGRRRVVSATRDGIHGLVVAAVAARHGIQCTIYICEPAYRRHFARVLQMRRSGAEVLTVAPAEHLDAAWQAALQAWLDDTTDTHYVSSLESGPHPFPLIVRDFQAIVGQEALIQLHAATGAGPVAVVAGVADGYVGLGLLHGLLGDERVALYCVEPPADAEANGGARYLREHQWLRATRRVQYVTAGDDEALQVVEGLFRATGMCVPTESARTLAYARRIAAPLDPGRSVLTLIASPEERPSAPT